MNRIQKISWLTVISLGVGFLLSVITVAVMYFQVGFPRALAGWAFLAIGGLGGLGQIIFKDDNSKVKFDERDQQINLQAARAGFGVSYMIFGILCMGLWFYFRSQGTGQININMLPVIFGIAGFSTFFVHALTILILYGRDKTDGEPDNG